MGAEVPIQPLARLGNVVKRFRLAADQREIILGHAEERSRFAAGRLFAVQAMTDGNEGGIGIEFKLDGAARALSCVLLSHIITFLLASITNDP
jgi:hypothetical protein